MERCCFLLFSLFYTDILQRQLRFILPLCTYMYIYTCITNENVIKIFPVITEELCTVFTAQLPSFVTAVYFPVLHHEC